MEIEKNYKKTEDIRDGKDKVALILNGTRDF